MPSDDFFREHSAQIGELLNRFNGFPNLDRRRIELWIGNFDDSDAELALKVLDNVEYFNDSRMYLACQEIFAQLRTLKGAALNNVYFCAFGSPAHSGQHIYSIFATANSLTGRANASRFKLISELNMLSLESNVTVVFLDDFIGTGDQSIGYWAEIESIVTDNVDVYLGVVAAFEDGIRNVQTNTPMKVLCYRRFNDSDKLFSATNPRFTEEEKDTLEKYCYVTGASNPEGYGNCQALVVSPYKTPNNTVAILTVQNNEWEGIFPRYPNISIRY